VSRSEQDGRRARQRFAESLTLQREIGNKQGVAECLAGLAGVDVDNGLDERGVRICAASHAMVAELGVPLAPADRVTMDRDMDVARSRLTGGAWDAAWTAGSAMSADDAIALALTPDPRTEPYRRPDPLSRREREVSALIARA
jgi:non-specific serine/threonine protein kinase